MPRYTDDSRDRVRDAVDMVALVESRVELRRAGVNSYLGCCPFHDERTASFHVRPDEKHYHCFGCAESGDPFDFVMATEGLDFVRAMETLADRFGVTLQTVEEDPEDAARRARRERLLSLLERTATFYERCLWESRAAAGARAYLLDRGFTEETLREFRIGFSPDDWEKVMNASLAAGFTSEELRAAGLIKESQRRPGRYFDFFRGKAMFPILDARGRVRGFGARRMGEQSGPKYVNTPDGDLYHKREVLYGISLARGAAAKAGRMILAEGYTDVMALHQAGVANAVGIMGTSLTREQVAELVRLVPVLELCLDADRAGQDAMVRAAKLCADQRIELRVIPLPPGADPGDLVVSEGAPALRARAATSVPYVSFEVGRVLDRADLTSAEGKDRAIAQLRPAFADVGPSVLRDDLVRTAAGRLGLDEARFVTLLAAGGSAGSTGGSAPGAGPGGPAPGSNATAGPGASASAAADLGVRAERSFLAMCLAGGVAGEVALGRIDPDALFTSRALRGAARRLAGRPEDGANGAGVRRADADPGGPGQVGEGGRGQEGEEPVTAAIEDLRRRAEQGPPVSSDQIEHARLLLELARVDRAIAHARAERAGGVAALAAERQRIRVELGHAVGRIERPM